MRKISALAQGVALFTLAVGFSAHAVANTAGGATIHNAATLSYAGGSTAAAVNVSVQTVAALPTVVKSTADQSVASYGTADYSFTVTSNSNGSDAFALTLGSSDANTSGTPTLSFLNGTIPVTSILLGASVTSQASGVGIVYIPAGSQANLSVNDVVSIGGNLYTITAVTAGTVASTTAGVTTAEVPTSVALTPVGAAPAITAGSVPAGVQVGEQVTLTQRVVASAPSNASTATHTVSFTATSTATDLAGSTVSYLSGSNGTNTITTVILAQTSLAKLVRNVSRATGNPGSGGVACGADTFFVSGVTVKTGDTLEYCLLASVATGQPNLTGAKLADPVPPFTSYVASSTKLNGTVVPDVSGSTPLAQVGGMDVNSAGAPAGTIVGGGNATVVFSVLVQ